MAKIKIETFDCPYARCVWPKCRNDGQILISRPACSSAVAVKRSAILRRFAIKPKQKRR